MGKISINYDCLSSAASNLRSGASTCRRYASSNLNSRCQNKLSGIEGGLSGSVCAAYDEVSEKQRKLNQKAVRLDALATAIDNLHQHAQNADDSVSTYVTTKASAFQTANGMECGLIEGFWNWICDGVSSALDSTGIGQWIADVFRNIGDHLSDFWRNTKNWYIYDGGKFWAAIGTGLIAIVVAVCTIAGIILTGGVGFLAIISIIGSAISIINACVKIGTNIAALIVNNDNPYCADHLGSIQKASDGLRTLAHHTSNGWANVLNGSAAFIDGVDTFCAIVGLIDSGTKLYETFSGKTTMFQKYLGQGGYLDNIFMENTTSSAPCEFDAQKMKWFKTENGVRTEIDWSQGSERSGFKLSFKTGSERLRSIPSSSQSSTAVAQTSTGFQILGNQFKSDLHNIHPIQDAKQMYQNGKTTASNTVNFLKSLKTNTGRQNAWNKLVTTESKWTKLDEIKAYLQTPVNGRNWAGRATFFKNCLKLPENAYKVATFDWVGFTDVGRFVNDFDDQIGNPIESLTDRLKESIWNLGKPAPQVSTP